MIQPPLKVVPKEILTNLTNSDFLKFYQCDDPKMLTRLVTYPEMESVWIGLNEREVDGTLAIDFFCSTALIRKRWQRMSKLPNKLIEESLLEVADLADRLARGLDRQKSELIHFASNTQNIASLLEDYIQSRKDLNEVTKKCLVDQLWKLSNQFEVEDSSPIFPDISTLLQHLAMLIRRFDSSREWELRPTKIAAINAERTYAIRNLSSFFYDNLREWRFDWVALTTTTMFDLIDDPMTEDHAKKLVTKYSIID
jgi:hypothetical protein